MSNLPTSRFEDLPDEIILQIFTHLEFYDNASASQVCQRWKLLSEDQCLWQKINLSPRAVPAKFIEKALRHGCQYLGLCGTRIMNVPCPKFLFWNLSPNLFSASNQLKYLSISCDNNINTEKHHKALMKNLLGATQQLEKLSIRCDRECGFHFQPNILQNNQTLTVLRITGLKSLSSKTVKNIFTKCTQLSEVSLEDCSMPVEALSFLCNNLTNKIKKLSLSFISAFDSRDYILNDEHIIIITNYCPKLEELGLGVPGEGISEVALSSIIEKLQNLVKLKLPCTGQIPFPKLLELGSMPNLKYLRVPVKHSVALNLNFHLRFSQNPEARAESLSEKIDELDRKKPFIKALVKNLPHLKINEGRIEIAAPDRCFSYERLWEYNASLQMTFMNHSFDI
jgi:hypothetical protein